MCLGLYEDTGSFTFPSTTERDFLAAAFLLVAGRQPQRGLRSHRARAQPGAGGPAQRHDPGRQPLRT
ncbi:MAG: hypothetical protein MZV70_07335 [Desulfobacterales bacterium]|nr:hypothetical protein [Desulfobacterales bacterium]